MKTRLILFVIFCASCIFIACAAAPLNRNVQNSDEEYEKGLKYSEWLYPHPIDILEEELRPLENSEETKIKEPIKNKRTLGIYSVQIASFKNEKNAKQYFQDISNKYSTFAFRLYFSGHLWKVLVGRVVERTDAEQLLQRLKMNGFSDAWIVQF